MKISFAKPKMPTAGALVLGVFEDRAMSPAALRVDGETGGALARAMASSRFHGKTDQLLTVMAPANLKIGRILLVGLGKPDRLAPAGLQTLGGRIIAALETSGEKEVAIALDGLKGANASSAILAANLAFGARLRSYRFDKYRTREKPEDKPTLRAIEILVDDPAAARRAYEPLEKLGDGVALTRDLVSEPANVIFPASLAAEARKLSDLGVRVEVLGLREMKKLGMGALLGVAQGSANEPRLVVMTWHGAPRAKDKRPIAFVGKGVTFDTGGISIKPAGGMEEMKWDMAGAGAVFGVMKALAGRKAKVNAIGIAGLVENMPSGTAQRPGDIVKSMSGQTIEVINTDAEGRLVLADAIWYTIERFKPRALIDLATLTGAIIISLGHVHAGLFANDDKLAEQLLAAGKAEDEPLWRMPLGEEYDKALRSEAADMKNVGDRAGGSITAAQFIQRFVKDTTWAHLDIAGMAWSHKDRATVPKGATGYGVRLLNRLVADHYETS